MPLPKLNGHWVAKRLGIVKHYKHMTASEIALFDVYCLLSNKQTFCCYRTLNQLSKIRNLNGDAITLANNNVVSGIYIVEAAGFGMLALKDTNGDIDRRHDEQED